MQNKQISKLVINIFCITVQSFDKKMCIVVRKVVIQCKSILKVLKIGLILLTENIILLYIVW